MIGATLCCGSRRTSRPPPWAAHVGPAAREHRRKAPMTWMARRLWITVAVLFGAGAMVGCGGGAANSPPPATAASAGGAEADDATAGLEEHHRYHHHGGVMLFIAMSLDTLGVSP